MNLQPLINIIQSRPFLLTAVFVLLGMLALIHGIIVRNYGKVINWAKTNGQFIDYNVTLKRSKRHHYNNKEKYVVYIRYNYMVNGRHYVGNKFEVDRSVIEVDDPKEGKRVAAKFTAHPNLIVYYNPTNPSDCTLKVGQRPKNEYTRRNFAAALVLLVFAIFSFLTLK